MHIADDIQAHLEMDYEAGELWDLWATVIQKLGKYKDEVYFYGIDTEGYNRVYDGKSFTGEQWSKSGTHTTLLAKEGRLFESLIPLFPSLRQPSLLLHGTYDPVCCEYQREAFLDQIPNGEMVVFEHSAHFPRLEEAEKYTNVVKRFLLNNEH